MADVQVRFLCQGKPLQDLPELIPMPGVPRLSDSVHLAYQRYRVVDVCWEPCDFATVHLALIGPVDKKEE